MKQSFLVKMSALVALVLASCSQSAVIVDGGPLGAPVTDIGGQFPSDGIWGIAVTTISGRSTIMGEFAGKAIMVINTASECGYTPQFDGLQRLHERYKERGLVLLGFPCNQFLGQDPGSDKDIADFCTANFGVSFQMMSKIEVNGAGRHALYSLLTEQSAEELSGDIGWNFEKFLIRPDGVPVARFLSTVEPEDARIISAIEAILP
jgi:glutathione peroxidase